mgnify:CR=1 FL=1
MIWQMFGLTLIIISWLVQLLSMWNKSTEINHWFVFLYSLGVLALIFGSFNSGSAEVAILNIITFIFTGVILLILFTNKDISKKRKKR